MDNHLATCNIIKNLKDAGFNDKQIDEFMQLFQNKDIQPQLLYLKCQRCILLEGLHDAQKKNRLFRLFNLQVKKRKMKSKKVLVIKASPRFNGNSDILADSFIKGVDKTNYQVKEIALRDHQIEFCQGCLACQNSKDCVIKDSANNIVQEIKNADVLVFATLVYFYQMNG